MTVYTTLPTDDLNLAVTVIDDPDLVVLNITPAAVNVTSAVTSVNGLVGTVTLDSDDIPEGTTNLYSDQPNSTTDDVTFNSVYKQTSLEYNILQPKQEKLLRQVNLFI